MYCIVRTGGFYPHHRFVFDLDRIDVQVYRESAHSITECVQWCFKVQ